MRLKARTGLKNRSGRRADAISDCQLFCWALNEYDQLPTRFGGVGDGRAWGVGHTWAMTDQEAEALAARLTRIWGEPAKRHHLNFTWPVPGGCIHTKTHPIYTSFQLDLPGLSLYASTGGAFIVGGEPPQGTAHWAYEQHEILKQEYVPFFRRGCWLSGCNIEASAHEKAEWMQGFSREEFEAWNLKM